jgi:hypothetical protein
MTTGKEVPLPPAAKGALDIIPLADGMFVRTESPSGTQTARLLAADGHQVASVPLPAGTGDLAYRP